MNAHLRGHVLLFDRPVPGTGSHNGPRLMMAAASLEIVRIAAFRWLYPAVPLWLLLPALLGLALLAVRAIAGVKLSQLGLRRWRDWTTTEKSYLVQVAIVANIVFPLVLLGSGAQKAPSQSTGLWWSLGTVFVPYLFFGFYQELVYRGMLQLEFVRRWGAPLGIVIANVLYTFGPLHWAYFASPASVSGPMLAAVFAIGLFFGVLYQRSGNLWIVAVFHAIGNAHIVWATGPGP